MVILQSSSKRPSRRLSAFSRSLPTYNCLLNPIVYPISNFKLPIINDVNTIWVIVRFDFDYCCTLLWLGRNGVHIYGFPWYSVSHSWSITARSFLSFFLLETPSLICFNIVYKRCYDTRRYFRDSTRWYRHSRRRICIIQQRIPIAIAIPTLVTNIICDTRYKLSNGKSCIRNLSGLSFKYVMHLLTFCCREHHCSFYRLSSRHLDICSWYVIRQTDTTFRYVAKYVTFNQMT